MAARTCPDLEQLEALVAARLDDDSRVVLESHVAARRECSSAVSEIRENLGVAGRIRDALAESGRPPVAGRIPARVGPYRVVRELGRGGMGVVYEAEQERPRRSVALKMLQSGCAPARMQRRFEQESHVLARLQHPGIARIYEAGTADDDSGPRPYFAMEFGSGPTLGRYAAQRRLDVSQRLEPMARTCDAVHYAHQRGVIHRNLKPSNIIVVETGDQRAGGARGAVGQPKILDFGVAKVTDCDICATTLHTDAGQLIGTIPCMSPEQVGGDPSAVDARSDVYTLGVVTYELLAGRLPYDLGDGAIADALRVIREADPLPLGSVSRAFRGDLETILSKALEKDPARRYPSAAELAADLRRYLRHEPIRARPPGAWYQSRRFAARNRGLVGASATAAFVLVLGAALSLWQAAKARRAEAVARTHESQAQREAAKARAVTDFLQEMLSSVDPSRLDGNRNLLVREALDRALEKIRTGSLDDQPEVRAAVQFTLGDTYRALGHYDQAEGQLRQALETRRSLHPEGHVDVAQSLNKLARTVEARGRFEEAEALFREALAMRRRLLGNEHADVATSLNNLAWLLHQRGRYDKAESMHREALAMRRCLLGAEHVDIASSLNNLAITLLAKGAHPQAEALFRESLAMDRRLRGDRHPNIAMTMTNLGLVLQEMARPDDAEPLLREALALRRRIFGAEHPDIATNLNNLALLLRDRDRLDEAEAMYHEALEMERRLRGADHPQVATTMCNLAALLRTRGRAEEAEGFYRQALEIRRKSLGDGHPHTLESVFLLGRVQMDRSNFAEAEPLLASAVEGARKAFPDGHRRTGAVLLRRGICLRQLGRAQEAETALLEAYELLKKAPGALASARREAASNLVELFEASGRSEEARRWRGILDTRQAAKD